MPIRPELRKFYETPKWEAARAGCRERAGDRCEKCGLPNGTVVLLLQGLRCVLIQCGAAHLNNVAGDDRPENLAWLCRGCHLTLDRPHHKKSRQARKDATRPILAAAETGYMAMTLPGIRAAQAKHVKALKRLTDLTKKMAVAKAVWPL